MQYDTFTSARVDVAANRQSRKWTTRELLVRTIWEALGRPLFSWTPRPFWPWRCTILRIFGAKIGQNVHLHPTVRIAIPWNLDIGDNVGIGDGAIIYSLGRISIGRDSTISQYAHLCSGTHDHRSAEMRLLKLPVRVGERVWVCADAFIGPGVSIGAFSIIAARAVVTKDVAEGVIVVGNPGRVIRSRPPISPPQPC